MRTIGVTNHPSETDVNTMISLETLLRDFQTYLSSIRNGDVTLADSITSITATQGRIDEKIKALSAPQPFKQRVDDFWEIVHPLVESLTQQPANLADNLSKIKVIDEQITRAVYTLAQITLPMRVNAMLNKERSGFCINFNENREITDLIPDAADRAALLSFMWSEPESRHKNGGA